MKPPTTTSSTYRLTQQNWDSGKKMQKPRMTFTNICLACSSMSSESPFKRKTTSRGIISGEAKQLIQNFV